MGNKPKRVRCPFCGKFMHLSLMGITDKGVLTREYTHNCGPESEQRYVHRVFWSPDGVDWYYVVGCGSYSDFLGKRHVWYELADKLSDCAKIESKARETVLVASLKAKLEDMDDFSKVMLYDEDNQENMYISDYRTDSPVIFLKHRR